MNLILLLSSASLFFVVYLIISTKKYYIEYKQLPKSISITFYNVSAGLFVAFLLYSCGTISIINLTIKQDCFILSNLGAWLLAGVGFMSNINNPTVKKFHMVGALSGFALIILGFWFDYSMLNFTIASAVIIVLVGIVLAVLKKHFVLWAIEIVAIVCMLLGYYILLLNLPAEIAHCLN